MKNKHTLFTYHCLRYKLLKMETHITDVFTMKTPDPSYISSDICLGKISLKKSVQNICSCGSLEKQLSLILYIVPTDSY